MIKNTLLFLMILINFASAQIKTLNILKDEVKEDEIYYDVRKNFIGENAKSYIGQDLYLKGKSEILQDYGYSDFKTNIIGGEVYKCCSTKSSFNSSYDFLNGKYFKVIDVIPNERTKNYPMLYSEYFLKLEENESKDIVYYKYDGKYEYSFPFIVVSHFEYLKEKGVGNKIIVSKNYFDNKDLKGNIFELKLGDVWTIEDITVENQYYKLVYVIKNSRGNYKTIDVSILNDDNPSRNVHYIKDYNKYKLKFGAVNWNKIFEKGEVVIGFTEEMCLMAWGKPNSIRKASYGDQWIYDDQYLYFKNGKLTSFN